MIDTSIKNKKQKNSNKKRFVFKRFDVPIIPARSSYKKLWRNINYVFLKFDINLISYYHKYMPLYIILSNYVT